MLLQTQTCKTTKENTNIEYAMVQMVYITSTNSNGCTWLGFISLQSNTHTYYINTFNTIIEWKVLKDESQYFYLPLTIF